MENCIKKLSHYSLGAIVRGVTESADSHLGGGFFASKGDMKTYYLQKDPTGREFIDDSMHEDCKEIGRVQAPSWKSARARFIALA